jgi:hypothetical protein
VNTIIDLDTKHPSVKRLLPNELVDVILEYIKEDGQLESLAAIARANQAMYDIAIPKLYETITVKACNQDRLDYGHTRLLASGRLTSSFECSCM